MPLVCTSWLIVHVRAVALAACEEEHSAGFWSLYCVVATDAEEDHCLFKSRDSLVGHCWCQIGSIIAALFHG